MAQILERGILVRKYESFWADFLRVVALSLIAVGVVGSLGFLIFGLVGGVLAVLLISVGVLLGGLVSAAVIFVLLDIAANSAEAAHNTEEILKKLGGDKFERAVSNIPTSTPMPTS
jgi:hypothetical protein